MEARHLFAIGAALIFVAIILWAMDRALERLLEQLRLLQIIDNQFQLLLKQLSAQHREQMDLARYRAVLPKPPVIDETAVLSPGEQHVLRQRQFAPRAP